MKRKNRIRKNADFKYIINKHKVLKNNEFVIYTNKNNIGYTRIGISVSRKLGNAVIRNKIKRQLKNIVKDVIQLDNSTDIVIIVREPFKAKTYQQNLELFKILTKGLNEK